MVTAPVGWAFGHLRKLEKLARFHKGVEGLERQPEEVAAGDEDRKEVNRGGDKLQRR